MSTSTQGASRATVRSARRGHYPDLAPRPDARFTLRSEPARTLPRELRVAGVAHQLRPVPYEPGEDTIQTVALIAPDGTRVEASEWDICYRCTCAAFDVDSGECDHTRALVRAGVFRPVTWSGRRGGGSCRH